MTYLEYRQPTKFIDSDHPSVIDFAHRVVESSTNDVDRTVALYEAVRDEIRYDPYRVDLSPDALRASAVLARGYAFCIPKAILLAAAARVLDIPSRLGFADVKNHLTTEKLRRVMRSDLFVYHGYTELYLEGRWLKATPAFNRSLCERFDVEPLPFDGHHDALLQQYDRKGNRYMEYVCDHGHFEDLPHERMVAAFKEHYPWLMADDNYTVPGDFDKEAAAEGTHPTS